MALDGGIVLDAVGLPFFPCLVLFLYLVLYVFSTVYLSDVCVLLLFHCRGTMISYRML
jgi:hypothetical protein